MWSIAQISFDLRETEGSICIVRIDTPAGAIELIGEVIKVGRTLHVNGAHVQGLNPGELRAGFENLDSRLSGFSA